MLIHPELVCDAFAVKQRMRSVQNIAKITSAMKMVAASKMRVAQSQTEKSRGMLTPFLTMLGDLPGADTENSNSNLSVHKRRCSRWSCVSKSAASQDQLELNHLTLFQHVHTTLFEVVLCYWICSITSEDL